MIFTKLAAMVAIAYLASYIPAPAPLLAAALLATAAALAAIPNPLERNR